MILVISSISTLDVEESRSRYEVALRCAEEGEKRCFHVRNPSIALIARKLWPYCYA